MFHTLSPSPIRFGVSHSVTYLFPWRQEIHLLIPSPLISVVPNCIVFIKEEEEEGKCHFT